MQRKLLIVGSLLLFAVVAFAQKGRKKKNVAAQHNGTNHTTVGAALPTIRFYRRDGVMITNEDLKAKAPTVIMLFNPTCEHCEEQARLLQTNLSTFSDVNLLLMAADRMGPYLVHFVNATGSDKFPSLQIGIDSSEYINKTFRYESLPQINVYNKQQKLVKIFSGITPIDSLQKYME